MSGKSLHVLMGGIPLGTITEEGGKHVLEYDPSWIARGGRAVPLSLSMPLHLPVHKGPKVTNFMWNLLPDSEAILDGWSKKFQVSARNPFALLSHTGEDCPGAVQIVRGDRLGAMADEGEIQWIDDEEVGRRLRELRKDVSSSGRVRGENGQFSLAGAQPKTALTRSADGRWGVPSGRMPTTHILKPPQPDLAGHAQNEHLCLRVAAALGERVANTTVGRFGDETAIVVERYDRTVRGERILRSHQEDMCQALGVHPANKYEAEGGPCVKDIMNDVLRWTVNSMATRRAFFRALAYNQVIGGSDAHAKNYSVQMGTEGKVRLAPLYDIASVLPYERDTRKLKMAMRIGGKYRFDEVMPRHWEGQARDCGMTAEDGLAPLRDMIARAPDAFFDAANAARAEGLDHPILDEVTDAVSARCTRLARIYGSEAIPPEPRDDDERTPGPGR